MDAVPVEIQWRRSASHRAIHEFLPQLQTGAPQAYEQVPPRIPHPLRQRIRNDVARQREASNNATIHNETLAQDCENLLAELEKNTSELSTFKQACQQQKDLAEENAGAASSWMKSAGDLQAEIGKMKTEWEEEKGDIEAQNRHNIDELNRSHLEERGDLQAMAGKAQAQITELVATTKQQEDRITELEKAIDDQSADLGSSRLELAAADQRATKAEQEKSLLETKHDEEIASSNERHAQFKIEADQEIHELRKVNEGHELQIEQLEASRDRFAASLLLQGVRAVKTNLLMWNTAGRLISRNWQLGKMRRQLQLSEQSVEDERKGYQQASAEYTAEFKLRKHWQKKHEDECNVHDEAIKKLREDLAQAKSEASKLEQERELVREIKDTLDNRTRQFDEKSAKCTRLSNELKSCKLQLSESKRTQEQESKRANVAEENAMTHLNARKEAEKERDKLKANMDTIESVFYQSRQDDKVGPLSKQQEDTTSTTGHDAPKAIDKVGELLPANEAHDIVRKDSHSPERNAIDVPSNTNHNKKRQADGKLPTVPKKRRTYDSNASRSHDIYRPPM